MSFRDSGLKKHSCWGEKAAINYISPILTLPAPRTHHEPCRTPSSQDNCIEHSSRLEGVNTCVHLKPRREDLGAKAEIRTTVLYGFPRKPSITKFRSSHVDMGVPQEKEKLSPRLLTQKTGFTHCLTLAHGCWINRMCVRRCVHATTVQQRLA